MNNMAANDMRMGKVRTKMGKDRQMETNQRFRTVIFLIVAVVILAAVTAAGILTEGYAVETDFSQRNLSPSLQHLFGTDWMGRDMLGRTLSGLSLSIRIGILTAVVSAAEMCIRDRDKGELGYENTLYRVQYGSGRRYAHVRSV